MQESFNLIAAGDMLRKKWKQVVLFTLLSGVVAGGVVFLVPRYYRSAATIVSANPVLADKARLFNSNIQGLYSYFGSGDDLDRIQGIADMDTTYKKLVDEFSLISYYLIKSDSPSLMRRNAVLRLRRDIHYERTEQGQLKIVAWTKQKDLSAALVNRMVGLVTETGTGIWQKNYSQALAGLDTTIHDMEQQYNLLTDSLAGMSGGRKELALAQLQSMLQQIKQYRGSADEFRLAARTQPAMLYVLEPAVPAAKAERPDKLTVILVACLLGFVFSCLLILVTNRKTVV